MGERERGRNYNTIHADIFPELKNCYLYNICLTLFKYHMVDTNYTF